VVSSGIWSFIIGKAGLLLCLLCCNIVAALLASCSSDDSSSSPSVTTHTYKVAVIMEQGEQARWERTAKWAQENIAEAQRDMSERMALQLTFKSQDDADIAEYMQQVAEDTTVVAIVGPTTSAYAEQMALALGKSKAGGKPMITPSATHVEYQRRFANVPYVWNMAESDIAQLEVLLSGIASMYGSDRMPVMLLCADDDEGDETHNAYAEWFGFIAEEYGLKVDGVFLYKDEADLRRYVRLHRRGVRAEGRWRVPLQGRGRPAPVCAPDVRHRLALQRPRAAVQPLFGADGAGLRRRGGACEGRRA